MNQLWLWSKLPCANCNRTFCTKLNACNASSWRWCRPTKKLHNFGGITPRTAFILAFKTNFGEIGCDKVEMSGMCYSGEPKVSVDLSMWKPHFGFSHTLFAEHGVCVVVAKQTNRQNLSLRRGRMRERERKREREFCSNQPTAPTTNLNWDYIKYTFQLKHLILHSNHFNPRLTAHTHSTHAHPIAVCVCVCGAINVSENILMWIWNLANLFVERKKNVKSNHIFHTRKLHSEMK